MCGRKVWGCPHACVEAWPGWPRFIRLQEGGRARVESAHREEQEEGPVGGGMRFVDRGGWREALGSTWAVVAKSAERRRALKRIQASILGGEWVVGGKRVGRWWVGSGWVAGRTCSSGFDALGDHCTSPWQGAEQRKTERGKGGRGAGSRDLPIR